MKKQRRTTTAPALSAAASVTSAAPTRSQQPLWRKTVIAALAAAMALPHIPAWATLELSQHPPSLGTAGSYIAPNVLISLDDSGSMAWRLIDETPGDRTMQQVNGKWPDWTPRMMILQDSLKKVFDPNTGVVPDGSIRLAWQAMHDNGNRTPMNSSSENTEKFLYGKRFHNGWGGVSPKGSFTQIKPDQKNAMRLLDAEHRANFLDFVDKLYPGDGTPSQQIMENAYNYMKYPKLDKDNPWAAIPGKQAEPFIPCRRAYHIFFTDGGWNDANYLQQLPTTSTAFSLSNQTLPDGVIYDVNSAFTNIYRSPEGNLANRALQAWATDLQPDIANKVPPSAAYKDAPDTEVIYKREDLGLAATYISSGLIDRLNRLEPIVRLPKYWNPKYDPATWQHMVTHTIGFSKGAVSWFKGGGSAYLRPPSQTVPFSYDGDGYHTLWLGKKQDSKSKFDNSAWPRLYDHFDTRRTGWTYYPLAIGAYLNSNWSGGLDLWGSAISGRGRYYSVEKAEDLEKAFRSIMEQIGGEPQPAILPANQVFSGSSAMRNDVGVFGTSFDVEKGWTGDVTGQQYAKGQTGTLAAIAGWGGKSAAELLDERGDTLVRSATGRMVITANDAGKGVPFSWPSDVNDKTISEAQKTLLTSENVVNYIRGDKSISGLRARQSRLGDIVNSQLWYTGGAVSNYTDAGYAAFVRAQRNRQPMLYVGANDGMLHGFSATNGKEQLAYIPKGVLRNLPLLTQNSYNENHRYFVDGSPMTGDVQVQKGTNLEWRTMLVGTLGAGGRGYFVLDVTKPGEKPANAADNPTGSTFAENNAGNLVVMDKTSHADDEATGDAADIGHIFAEPVTNAANRRQTTQITRMNDGRWAVVMGNGYNSANERPVLLIQYLDGQKELKTIVATGSEGGGASGSNYQKGTTENTTDNGLSAPRVVDLNNDGKADLVYAGDLKGNMWKFDLTSKTAANWHVAFGGQPLFTAESADGKRQPITAAPVVRANNQNAGGMMVAFGTGRNITKADINNQDQQTLYSVQDNTRYKVEKESDGTWKDIEVHPGDSGCQQGKGNCVPAPSPVGKGTSKLVEQTVGNDSTAQKGSEKNADRKFWQASDHPVDWSEKRGWFMKLPIGGERLLKHMGFYEGTNILAVFTDVPNWTGGSTTTTTQSAGAESCEGSPPSDSRQFLTLLNIMDGRRPRVQIFDKNDDGYFNADDGSVTRVELDPGRHTIVKKSEKFNKAEGPDGKGVSMNRPPEIALRPSWRQLR